VRQPHVAVARSATANAVALNAPALAAAGDAVDEAMAAGAMAAAVTNKPHKVTAREPQTPEDPGRLPPVREAPNK
jgi:hypothetical protein